MWDDPGTSVSFLAMQVGLVVRDRFPEQFLRLHAALFAARHDDGVDLRQEGVLRQVLIGHDVDPDAVFDEMATGAPLEATWLHGPSQPRRLNPLTTLSRR